MRHGTVLLRPLDTPIKRIGFLLLLAGLVTLIAGLVQIASSDGYYSSSLAGSWLRAVSLNGHYLQHFPAAAYGTFVCIAGTLLSYGYDHTIGKIAAWIKNG